MKTLILVGLLGLFASSAHAELPSMCFDGTYAGGDECVVIINGEKVDDGLVADGFFKSEDELLSDLGKLFNSLYEADAQ